MWVFNLPGPAFLGWYFCFALALTFANLIVLQRRQLNSSSDHARLFFNAPYLLAYLAQGQNHCLAVCAFNLIDRGLCSASNQQITAAAGSSNTARHPLELAVLAYATAGPVDLFKAAHNSAVKAALAEINSNLCSLGLLNQQALFTPTKLLCVFLLLSVGLTKIVIALHHGHHNIGLLVVLMVIFSLVYLLTVAPRLTGSGKKTLSTLHNLLAQLHARAADLQPGGFTPEATLAAALFGLAVLPAHAFPYAAGIIPPQATSSGDSSSSGSSDSSCGSSCSSGCGGCGS